VIKIKSRVAVHDGVARRRRDFTPVSNRAQPRAGKGNTGWGWLVTSREVFWALEQWQRHGEGSGWRRRRCDYAEEEQWVQSERIRRGRERIEVCPKSRTPRKNSLRQRTRRGPNCDGGTGTWPRRTVVALHWCVHSARRGWELCGCANEGGGEWVWCWSLVLNCYAQSKKGNTMLIK
jgi:hypothetical protein